MKQLLLLTVLLVLTISCMCQKKYHWSNFHGPKKIEYFKKGDTLVNSCSFEKVVVIKARQLNKQYSYYEQGYYKRFSDKKLRRIFKRNCRTIT